MPAKPKPTDPLPERQRHDGHGPLVTDDPQVPGDAEAAPEELPGGGGVITTDSPDEVEEKRHTG